MTVIPAIPYIAIRIISHINDLQNQIGTRLKKQKQETSSTNTCQHTAKTVKRKTYRCVDDHMDTGDDDEDELHEVKLFTSPQN